MSDQVMTHSPSGDIGGEEEDEEGCCCCWAARWYPFSGRAKFCGGSTPDSASASLVPLDMATKRWRWKARQLDSRLRPPVATPRHMAVPVLDDQGVDAPSDPVNRSSPSQYMGAGRSISLLTASLEPPNKGNSVRVALVLMGSTKMPSRACRSGWWQKRVLRV
ncbi:hypothetical protein VTK26DRAFT_7708 [Humicola hyalothermophila]